MQRHALLMLLLRRPDRLVALIGLLLGIPDCIVATLQLSGLPPNAFLVRMAALMPLSHAAWIVAAGVALYLLRSVARKGWLWPMLNWLARFRLQPADVSEALRRAPICRELLQVQVPLLAMSARDLALRAGIYRWEAEFMIRNPTFIPRHDVERQLRVALMIPDDWGLPNGGYGPHFTRLRIDWHAKNGNRIWTAPGPGRSLHRREAAALRRLEKELRAALQPLENLREEL